MKVTLLAQTELTWRGLEAFERHGFEEDPGSRDVEDLVEFAGRLCYKSFNKPNPATATNQGYIANLLEHQHLSVLEHGSVTFLFEEVSRNLTHELVRHRHLSFSQVSQRYVDESAARIVLPEVLQDLFEEDEDLDLRVRLALTKVRSLYSEIADTLKQKGLPKKKAQQAARFILPGSTETSIVVTGNHRSWREFIDKRYSEFADPEIRELAGKVLVRLKDGYPNIYQDFQLKEF